MSLNWSSRNLLTPWQQYTPVRWEKKMEPYSLGCWPPFAATQKTFSTIRHFLESILVGKPSQKLSALFASLPSASCTQVLCSSIHYIIYMFCATEKYYKLKNYEPASLRKDACCCKIMTTTLVAMSLCNQHNPSSS